MNKKNGKKTFSIRQFYRIILSVLIAISVVLGGISVFTNTYFINVENNQIRDTYETQKENIMSSFTNDELYFSYLLLNSNEIKTLAHSNDEVDVYLAKDSLSLIFNTYLTQNKSLSYVAFYNENNDQFISYDNGLQYYLIEERDEIRNNFKEYVESYSLLNTDSYFTLNNSLGTYMCRALSLEGSIIFFAYNFIDVVKNFTVSSEVSLALIYKDKSVSLRDDLSYEYVSSLENDRIVIHKLFDERLVKSEFYDAELVMVYKIKIINLLAGLTNILLYIVLLIVTIVSIYSISKFKKKIVDPLKDLEATMNEIARGNVDLRIEEGSGGEEIKEINRTFNKMLENIHELKIESYEKEIDKRKSELKFLQLQIRPHFYLNCLKNMYVLAVDNKLEKIEESILLLSNYLRYSFTIQENGVKLADEIKQCENYTKLIAQSAKYPPVLITDIEEGTSDIFIPSISLLTFLENTYKHAPVSRRVVTTFISAKFEENNILHLSFLDDGEGVDEKTLDKLNNFDWSDSSLKEHTGIRNVINRFKLIFSKAPKVIFSNRGGFRVDIFIDLKEKE